MVSGGVLLDYFEAEDWVDAARVGIQGHLRYGKAAAVAMDYGPRLAIRAGRMSNV